MTVLGEPYWRHLGAPPPAGIASDLDGIDGPVGAVVIGAGFTGLSAALTLAREGARVVVLDAGEPGEGASTRNGGMIGWPHLGGMVDTAATDISEMAMRYTEEGRAALAYTTRLFEAEGIDADFRRCGRLQLAFTRADFEGLKRQAAHPLLGEALGLKLVEKADLKSEIGTDSYFGGLLFPDHGGVNPRKMHDGLLRAALAAGARVIRRCPARGIARRGDGFRVETQAGPLDADAAILATNGYTPGWMEQVTQRLFPVPSFIIATDPIAPDLAARLAPGGRMMVETRIRHAYFRLSPDGTRLLFGGRAALHAISPDKAAVELKRLMVEIYPELRRVGISHSWSGRLGFTFARRPHIGEENGVHFAVGYSGNGVALSPWFGRKAALRALGRPEGETVFADTPWETRPHRRLMPVLLPVASRLYRLRDVYDQVRARM